MPCVDFQDWFIHVSKREVIAVCCSQNEWKQVLQSCEHAKECCWQTFMAQKAQDEHQRRHFQHLESCRPGQDQANWYVLVRIGTYQYKVVQASTGFPRLVQAGTRQYRISPRLVQVSTTRYNSVQEFFVSVEDGTSQYRISRICTKRYKMVQVST